MTAKITTIHDQRPVNWTTTVALIIFHVGAVAAPFFFEWRSVMVATFLYWLAISCGIGMGYHRLHTHRGYKIPKMGEYFLGLCGSLALEGGPIFWVATHRVHHAKSDKAGDPHSPRDGAWWSHMGWIITGAGHHNKTEQLGRMAPDLYADPFYRWLNTWHWLPLTIVGVALAIWAYTYGGWYSVVSMVTWSTFLRVTLGLHSTWLVNSATHMWGNKRFKTTDDSRNNWWVALLTFGEGWHNNHHAHPASARHGLAWYELDITWLQIRLLQALGVAKMVKVAKTDSRPLEEREAA